MDAFSSVEPFLPGLKLYCRTLARNEWDAEDLLQEALMKIYRSIQQSPNRPINKAYLRLIAKNAWIDHCRRQQTAGAGTLFDEEMHHALPAVMDEMAIRESLEQLADQLNPRQMVLILIMDIFKFSAAETADLLHTTVGAVKEGVKRARHRLKVLAAAQSSDIAAEKKQSPKSKLQPEAGVTRAVFEQFLIGFRAGDPAAICRTYLALAAKGIHIEKVSQAVVGTYSFVLRDPNGHLIGFFQEVE